jgi:hypothetical protein
MFTPSVTASSTGEAKKAKIAEHARKKRLCLDSERNAENEANEAYDRCIGKKKLEAVCSGPKNGAIKTAKNTKLACINALSAVG